MTDHTTGPRKPQRRAFLGGVGLGVPAVLMASTLLEGCTAPPTKTGSTGFQVRDFGAKGDGVTDDTAAFGQAFAAVSAYGGGVVYVPPGRYRVSKLFVPAGCVLTGAGTASWIQLLDNTNATMLNIVGVDVTVSNLQLDGNAAGQSNTSKLYDTVAIFPPAQRVRIHDCWVHDAIGYQVVAFPGCSDIVVARNIVSGGAEEGIECQGSSDFRAVGNLVQETGKNGIYVWSNTAQGGTCHSERRRRQRGQRLVAHQHRVGRHRRRRRRHRRHDHRQRAGRHPGHRDGHRHLLRGPTTAAGRGDGERRGRRRRRGGARAQQPPHRGQRQRGVQRGRRGHPGLERGHRHHGRRQRGRPVGQRRRADPQRQRLQRPRQRRAVERSGDQGRAGRHRHRRLLPRRHGRTRHGGRPTGRSTPPRRPTQVHGTGTAGAVTNVVFDANVVDGNASISHGTMLANFPGGATLLPTRAIRSVAVGQTQVAVLHGLGHTPGSVVVTARSAGQVWQSAAPNAYFVYLTADAAGRSCDLLVG